jgi:acetyl coenzyme A synthetase (ADP forming)-like protein
VQRARRQAKGLTLDRTTRDGEAPAPGQTDSLSRARVASPRTHGLEAVFRPRSIAVIGASRTRGSIGAAIFHNLIERGFEGPVFPVHPHAAAVGSVKAYPTIADVPGDIDLAVIVVPAARALEVLEACGAKGVRAAVVISAGFKESGPEGRAREQALLECARGHGMRLIGPNCLGVLNTEPAVSLDATFAPTFPPHGGVAFSSQSGALGLAILDLAKGLNIGISHFVSVGNKADVSGNDLLEFWERDPGTRIILLYLESFGNPRRFIEIARRVPRTKPVVAVKSGRSVAGARAASSHTGSLAGADAAVDALCRQSGVIRTDTMEELFDVAMLLAHQPVPRGRRVAIVTNAGGPGIMASDACEGHGLEVPALAEATVVALRAFLPPEASTRNPVDMIASAVPASFEKAVQLVARDPNVDAVLAIYVPPIVTRPLDVARAIVRGADASAADARARGETPKPILTCFLGSHGVPEGLQSLHEGNIPSYSFPEAAAIALARAVGYGAWLAAPVGRSPALDGVDTARARAAITAALSRCAGEEATVWLRPDELHEVLAAYGLRAVPTLRAASEGEAVAVAASIGYPVVVKFESDEITHKSDVGGVILDVRHEDEVRRAWNAIRTKVKTIGFAREMRGVSVQPFIPGGIEVIVGVTQDPSFGPLIMFGLGGVHVELLKDVAFRLHPLTDRDAAAMVREVRGHPLLEGYRGQPPGDIGALEDVLMRVSRLVGDLPEIVEMDLNPLKVMTPGNGCVAVDARIGVLRS